MTINPITLLLKPKVLMTGLDDLIISGWVLLIMLPAIWWWFTRKV